ncbi:hypothetical protein [Aliidiomarina maris]|uniref:Uncharacterized protein n=1 Tax=Aliidiomarina maris TaxID=531312 RepID=A0A327WSN8_9GAMM|nr:hypothetical protein [Aliidiomarina maris]RAJ95324.1 hypothetical protein B0I24_1106 [Aliidiomarina maris]RUO22782.1 hypothetical protein CWE07_11005 [Aliidiomarina maris]
MCLAKLTSEASEPLVAENLIIRTVASSTAIETGQSVLDIERKLKEAEGKYRLETWPLKAALIAAVAERP